MGQHKLLDFGMEVWDDPSLEVEEEKEESKSLFQKS
jgi:hypothetical protein